jgi:hypothetical protein
VRVKGVKIERHNPFTHANLWIFNISAYEGSVGFILIVERHHDVSIEKVVVSDHVPLFHGRHGIFIVNLGIISQSIDQLDKLQLIFEPLNDLNVTNVVLDVTLEVPQTKVVEVSVTFVAIVNLTFVQFNLSDEVKSVRFLLSVRKLPVELNVIKDGDPNRGIANAVSSATINFVFTEHFPGRETFSVIISKNLSNPVDKVRNVEELDVPACDNVRRVE